MGEACTCHQQIPPFDWRVPTAVVEVQQAPVQALQQNLRHGAAMHNLHSKNTPTGAHVSLVFLITLATEDKIV